MKQEEKEEKEAYLGGVGKGEEGDAIKGRGEWERSANFHHKHFENFKNVPV